MCIRDSPGGGEQNWAFSCIYSFIHVFIDFLIAKLFTCLFLFTFKFTRSCFVYLIDFYWFMLWLYMLASTRPCVLNPQTPNTRLSCEFLFSGLNHIFFSGLYNNQLLFYKKQHLSFVAEMLCKKRRCFLQDGRLCKKHRCFWQDGIKALQKASMFFAGWAALQKPSMFFAGWCRKE